MNRQAGVLGGAEWVGVTRKKPDANAIPADEETVVGLRPAEFAVIESPMTPISEKSG